MTFVSDIQNTSAFQLIADKTAQRLLLQKTSREKINHGVNVSRNIGFDKWVATFYPCTNTQSIVEELMNPVQKNCTPAGPEIKNLKDE